MPQFDAYMMANRLDEEMMHKRVKCGLAEGKVAGVYAQQGAGAAPDILVIVFFDSSRQHGIRHLESVTMLDEKPAE